MDRNLVVRALSGLVYVLVTLGAVYAGLWGFALFLFIVAMVSLWEFYHISTHLGVQTRMVVGFLMGLVVFASSMDWSCCGLSNSSQLLYLLIPLVMWLFVAELYSKREQPFHTIAYTLLGVVYVVVPLTMFNVIYPKAGANLILSFFVLMWANDTFAYLFGRQFGKHKIFPRVSPKKSWEGYIGGIVSVVGVACLLYVLLGNMRIVDVVAYGLIVASTGLFGDLIESLLKRTAGVKDSGSIMPGHGGLLDRFDAVLFSLPLIYMYTELCMN